MDEVNAQIGRRHIRLRPVGPFDQTQTTVGKVFVQTRIEKLFRKIEPIEIKVI